MDKKIQFLIPHFGRQEFLVDCIESLLLQENPNWDAIVLNDDPQNPITSEVWGHMDARVRVVENSKNLGVTENFNQCLRVRTCELFVILGSDDRLLPNFVDEALKLANLIPKASMYQLGVQVIDTQGKPVNPIEDRVKTVLRPKVAETALLESPQALNSLTRGNWLYFPSIVWRASQVGNNEFDAAYKVVQDLDLVTRLLMKGGRIGLGRTLAFQYRRHPKSASSLAGITSTRYVEEAVILTDTAQKLKALRLHKASLQARFRIIARFSALVGALRALRSRRFLDFWKIMKVSLSINPPRN